MITLENISLSFANKKLFENFNLKINRGDKILLYGKSGTGKSSLLKMLLGFQIPDSGSIYFNGKISDQKSIWEFRKKVGYVSQDTDIGQGKINDLLEEILNYSNHRELEPDRKSLVKYLEFFELPASILEKDIADISGGEKQRVAAARALVQARDALLLDEATSNLDIYHSLSILNVIRQRAADQGLCVVAAVHDINLASFFCDEFIFLFAVDDKRLVVAG